MLTAAQKEEEVIASWFCFAAGHQSSPLEMQTAKDVIASLASHHEPSETNYKYITSRNSVCADASHLQSLTLYSSLIKYSTSTTDSPRS